MRKRCVFFKFSIYSFVKILPISKCSPTIIPKIRILTISMYIIWDGFQTSFSFSDQLVFRRHDTNFFKKIFSLFSFVKMLPFPHFGTTLLPRIGLWQTRIWSNGFWKKGFCNYINKFSKILKDPSLKEDVTLHFYKFKYPLPQIAFVSSVVELSPVFLAKKSKL